MFAVVKFTEKERSLKGLFSSLKVKSEKVDLPSGGYFFIITAEKRKNRIPFDKIIRIAGNLVNSLIFPSDYDFTGDERVKPYEPSSLKERMLFELAVKGISKTGTEPSLCSVCVEDNKGIYVSCLHKLLPLAAKIQVVCARESIYSAEAERLFYEFGCSVIMSSELDSFSLKCDAVISYNGDEKPFLFGSCVYSKSIYSRVQIGLPREYASLCPDGTDRETFASALYEKCKVPYEIFFLDNIPAGDIY